MQLMESVFLLLLRAVAMATGINSNPCQWSIGPGWSPKEGDDDDDDDDDDDGGDGYLVTSFIAQD